MLLSFLSWIGRGLVALFLWLCDLLYFCVSIALVLVCLGVLAGTGIGELIGDKLNSALQRYDMDPKQVVGALVVGGLIAFAILSETKLLSRLWERMYLRVRLSRIPPLFLALHALLWILGTVVYLASYSTTETTRAYLFIAFNVTVIVAAFLQWKKYVLGHVAAALAAGAWIGVICYFAADDRGLDVIDLLLHPQWFRIPGAHALIGFGYVIAALVGHLAVLFYAAAALWRRRLPPQPAADGVRGSVALLWCFWGSLGFLAVLAMWHVSQDAWWGVTFGRNSELYFHPRFPANGADRARTLAGSHPEQPRLYYLSAGLHLADGNDLAAALSLKAYASVADASFLVGVTERLAGRFRLARRAFDQTMKGIDERLSAGRTDIYELLMAARPGSVPLATRFSPADILRTGVTGAQKSVLNLDLFPETGVACMNAKACSSAFKTASTPQAFRSGIAEIGYPRAGKTCCAVSLADRDLRLFDLAAAKDDTARSPELAAQVLAVASRMLLKQLYLRNFILNSPSVEP